MIISLLRNIIPSDKVVRQSGTKEGLVGNELNGKVVGIVGTGAIGLKVAELLKVFHCKLLGYSCLLYTSKCEKKLYYST